MRFLITEVENGYCLEDFLSRKSYIFIAIGDLQEFLFNYFNEYKRLNNITVK